MGKRFKSDDDFQRAFGEAAPRVFSKLILAAETQVKIRTPVKTGRLVNSVEGVVHGANAGNTTLEGAIRSNVEYAGMVEFGTANMEPRAMFRNGMAAMEKLGPDLIKDFLTQEGLS